MNFPLKISVNVTNMQFLADLVTFTEEILKGKLHFLCSDTNDDQETKLSVPLFQYHSIKN